MVLLDKSLESIEASKLLIQEELFASSVHCSYYSCIQLMRHILFNIFNISEDLFDKEVNETKAGSHNYLINQISTKISFSNFERNDFKNKFRDIKELRKNADYKQILILEKDCYNAINLASSINHKLKSIYTK